MTTIDGIIDSIDERLRYLNEEIDALDAARRALDGRNAKATKSPRRRMARSASAPDPKISAAATPAASRATQHRDGDDRDSQASPPKPRRAAQRARRPRATRALEVVPAGKLEHLLGDTGGLTTGALAEKANADRDQVLTLLRELETAGRIRRTGQRRATRWHVITDEERIQERAAELAARSKSAAR